tara:strand:+ start:57 stop:380 length:324 start_codon:yes stop_codon:yes gene_type:complete
MSNDLLDKNGVWQGTQKEYFDFAKDIIEDALDGEHEGIIESILKDILKEIPQKKLEFIISNICEDLEEQMGSDDNKLGLLIKVNENEGSPIEPINEPIVDPNDLNNG